MSDTSTTTTPTINPDLDEGVRFYAANTIKGEFTRRKNNKKRDKKAHAANWALAKLSKVDSSTLLAGGSVTVIASTGRCQTITVRTSDIVPA